MSFSQNFSSHSFHRDHYLISTASDMIDVDVVHQYLAQESYWSPGIARETVICAIENSLCFGVYDLSGGSEVHIGFARVITDYCSFAYLADVFILSSYRSQGLGKWLITCILQYPDLQKLRKWNLNTRDAHDLYRRYGFRLHMEQDTFMTYRPQGREAARAA